MYGGWFVSGLGLRLELQCCGGVMESGIVTVGLPLRIVRGEMGKNVAGLVRDLGLEL